MPPKAKKIDPEVQKQQFETWLQSDEYRVWDELRQVSEQIGEKISETVEDLTGNWQIYHDKFFELTQVFKVKSRLKGFAHEHVRTFFFAREDEEQEKTVKKLMRDGFHVGMDKEYSANAWNLRKGFVEVYRTLEEFPTIAAEDYMVKKKALQKLMSEFVKRFQGYIKTQHKFVDEKLSTLLGPLRRLLEINRKLFLFEMKYKNEKEKLIQDFIYQAQVELYCKALQDCQDILYLQNQIVANPDVHRIFNKLHYKDWEANKIESFYLMPLKKAFDKLKLNLICLMTKGINYYKTPLVANVQFMADLNELINCELIAERLLGNPLKRDQINFMYKVICLHNAAYDHNDAQEHYNQIEESKNREEKKEESTINPTLKESIIQPVPLKNYLKQKDENCLKGSIPKLVVYETIVFMRNWRNQKAADELKEEEDRKKHEAKKQVQIEDEGQDNDPSQSGFYLSPEKKRQQEEEARKKEELLKQAEENRKLKEQADQEKYGRYWVWEIYCTPENKQVFEDCVEMIRHINKAVQQDIQDEIIREGMIPKIKDRQSKELKEASENLNKLRTQDNAIANAKQDRPPDLWNYPKIVQDNHYFRSIADPKKCYIDKRVEALEENIYQLGEHLLNNKPQSWGELVNRCIDALNLEYNTEFKGIEEGQ